MSKRDDRGNQKDPLETIEGMRKEIATLRASEGHLRILLDTVSDVVWYECQVSRGLDYANKAIERVYGRPLADFFGSGTAWKESLHPDDRERAIAEAAEIEKRGRVESQYRIVRPDGEVRWLHDRKTVVPDESGGGYFIGGITSDITERRRMEERVRQGEKMEAIGQLAGGIAHDFNNQLSGILGFAELLTEQLEDPEQLELAEEILRAAIRSSRLTSQLLAFARKGRYEAEIVDLHQIVGEVISLLSRSLDKRIVIRRDLRAHPSSTLGDPSQLQNALLNLALNARDAMRSGGQLLVKTESVTLDAIAARALPFAVDPGPYVAISVTDNGIGMNESTRKRIFEPFFTTKEPGQGTGMGLAGVYGTVRNHGGTLKVTSAPEEGTKVEIFLPVVESRAARVEAAEARAEVRPSASILVVDDESVVRNLLTRMLRGLGYDVVAYGDPLEAIDHYRDRAEEFDLVMLDMRMPEMSGSEVYAALREIHPEIRAILVSGYSVDREARAMLDDGVRRFLQKPFRRSSLAQAVAEALAD